jgi:exonuclease VII small subunit
MAFEAGRMLDTGPTMLKSLEELLSNIEEDVPLDSVTRHFRDAMDHARTAIAKARGTAS